MGVSGSLVGGAVGVDSGALLASVYKPVVKGAVSGGKSAAGISKGPKAPGLGGAPSAEDISSTMPDRTRRRVQLSKQQQGTASTILTGPSGVTLGNDATQARATLLGS